MLHFVLAGLLLPGLILANTQCPSGDISCPEGKTCCTVEGMPSCCDEDAEAKLPLPATLPYSSRANVILQNGTWSTGCTIFNCDGTCCNSGSMGCCPIKRAKCCSASRCCKLTNLCCGDGCCPNMAACCEGYTCCELGSTCCGAGCCSSGFKCCGTWCCKNSERCGLAYKTCHNAATKLAPTAAMVSVVVLWLAVRMVFRI